MINVAEFTLGPPFTESNNLCPHSSHFQQTADQHDETERSGLPSSSSLLPVVYQDKTHSLQIINGSDEASIQKYLSWDLMLPRLNKIHDYLWLAGRPINARSLHRQVVLGRAIVITEQVDLHMVRQDSRIFLKPMPDYLLNCDFWRKHLCKDNKLYECACGFLLSYIWLICSRSDLRMAQREHLCNPDITWAGWQNFTRDLISSINIKSLHHVNKRYHYGELRLSRLNWIYRLFSHNSSVTTIIRGYMYGYYQYSDILRRNFAWILIAFVYVSIVLTAMQVGLATERLGKSNVFQRASYGFAVFSMITPLVTFAVVTLNFLGLSIFNLTATVLFKRETDRIREKVMAAGKHQTV